MGSGLNSGATLALALNCNQCKLSEVEFFLGRNHARNVCIHSLNLMGGNQTKSSHKFRLSKRTKLSSGIGITAHRLAWPSHT